MRAGGVAAAATALAVWAAGGCAPTLMSITFYQPLQQFQPARLPAGATEHHIATADGDVQLFHVAHPGATRCVIYFHGTGGFAAGRLPLAAALAGAAECDVVVAEYRGYGASAGEPSEPALYEDARSAARFARERLGHAPERTVLIGRSLGTAVACAVMNDAPYAGAALLTPFSSGQDVAAYHSGRFAARWLGTPFDSASRLPRFHGRVLVVHGTDDAIVPFEEGERLFALANEPKEFVRVEGGTHNRIFPDDPTGARRLAAFVRACTP